MRAIVGPTDPIHFDNPEGNPIFDGLPNEAYDSVLDFGCGCGRLARQMLQQHPRPARYLGIDLHPALVKWCKQNLTPVAPEFEFRHHDVRYEAWNPGDDKPEIAPFPVEDASRSLVIAYSVFTHLTQEHAEYYLDEVARSLRPGGFLESTWFLFDKALFPMMQDFQNALYINDRDPSNAAIFDRGWLVEQAHERGLTVVAATAPVVRGFHWQIRMTPSGEGAESVELPADEAPVDTGGTRAAVVAPDLDRS